jgi:hypothetical protein
LAKNEIQNKKCQKAPLVTSQQTIKQKKRLNKLARNLMRPTNGCDVILDDECYFSLSGHDLASNSRYYCQRGEKVSPDIQFTKKSKFPQRYLLWLAISAKGISKPFFSPKNCSVNSEIYINKCIKKRLLPFIKDNYPNDNYIFWPDLASAHYSNSAQNAYQSLSIKVVPKEDNPPNVPQLRPIEDFWYILKCKVYENGWEAKNAQLLKKRISLKLKEFDQNFVQRLMKKVKTNIRIASRNGAEELVH